VSHEASGRSAPTGALLSNQGEDIGTQGRQVACPTRPELQDLRSLALGLL
jgi:hypothetical protein